MNTYKKTTSSIILTMALFFGLLIWSFFSLSWNAHAETLTQDLNVSLSARAKWSDSADGQASLTLQYASDSGTAEGTKDMDVILIQDKSGSMDCNYGLHINLAKRNLSEEDATSVTYYPIRNSLGWTESTDDIAKESNYEQRINTSAQGAFEGRLTLGDYLFSAPCQEEEHYYFLTASKNSFSAYHFIHGNQLYNLEGTDGHHYIRLDSKEEALEYLAQKRRVVRTKAFYSGNGTLQNSPTDDEHPDGYEYFLDVSNLYIISGKEWLQTCPLSCQEKDRLRLSGTFMKELIRQISALNPNSRIAYLPFWSNVPEDGVWENLTSDGDTGSKVISNFGGSDLLTQWPGVNSYGLTSSEDFERITEQIDHPFTYNGTNWTRAFEKALEILESRTESDKDKETLIIFLTDGAPQGYLGVPSDIENPSFNGSHAVEALKSIDGVTIYSCGICIDQSTDTYQKMLDAIDSRTQANIIQTTNEFDTLTDEILKEIQKTYALPVTGQDAFYTASLGDSFSLDITKTDASWTVLPDAKDDDPRYGVPEAVRLAVSETTRKVYVQSTHTVYWYIGDLTDGDLTSSGHACTFPLAYTDFDTIPTKSPSPEPVVCQQPRIIYHTSLNPEQVLSKSTAIVTLLFSREALPDLSVTKQFEGAIYQSDKTFSYVCLPAGYSASYQSDQMISLTIQSGCSFGTAKKPGLRPGKYEVFELDENQNKIASSMQTISVSQNASVSTRSLAETPYASASISSKETLENQDNLLSVTSKHADLTFVSHITGADLTITKTLSCQDLDFADAYGNPAFPIRISGIGTDGTAYCFFHTFHITAEDLKQAKNTDTLTLSYTFRDIPISTSYKVEEVCVSRYRLKRITGNGDHIQILQPGSGGTNAACATVNLQLCAEGSCVNFYNRLSNFQHFSHTAYVENPLCQNS